MGKKQNLVQHIPNVLHVRVQGRLVVVYFTKVKEVIKQQKPLHPDVLFQEAIVCLLLPTLTITN
jgi:hypothetical protein